MANNRSVRFVEAWQRHVPLLPLLIFAVIALAACNTPTAQTSDVLVAPSPVAPIGPSATATPEPLSETATITAEMDPDEATKIAILSQITPYPTIAPSAPFIKAHDDPRMFDFLDEAHGWLAVDNNVDTVINGGESWINEKRVQTLLSTSDGGLSWQIVYTSTGIIDAVSFTSPTTGWMTMSDALFATYDGGVTWQLSNNFLSSHFDRLWGVDFVDADSGWIKWRKGNELYVDLTEGLVHTTDGGITWTETAMPCLDPIYGSTYSFVNANTGWIMCGSSYGAGHQWKSLFRTDDGGQNWRLLVETPKGIGDQPTMLPIFGFVDDLAFADDLNGWFSSGRAFDGGVTTTTDGGITWENGSVTNSSAGRPTQIRLLSPAVGYAIAYQHSDFGCCDPPPPFNFPFVYTLVKTTDAGATWTGLYPTSPTP